MPYRQPREGSIAVASVFFLSAFNRMGTRRRAAGGGGWSLKGKFCRCSNLAAMSRRVLHRRHEESLRSRGVCLLEAMDCDCREQTNTFWGRSISLGRVSMDPFRGEEIWGRTGPTFSPHTDPSTTMHRGLVMLLGVCIRESDHFWWFWLGAIRLSQSRSGWTPVPSSKQLDAPSGVFQIPSRKPHLHDLGLQMPERQVWYMLRPQRARCCIWP